MNGTSRGVRVPREQQRSEAEMTKDFSNVEGLDITPCRGYSVASAVATSYSQDKVAARVRMKEKESAAAQILSHFPGFGAAVNLSFSFRTPATS